MFIKDVLKSRTIWFNGLVSVVAIAGIFGFGEYVPSLGDQEAIDSIVLLVAAAVPVINMILRVFFTKGAVSIFGKPLAKESK